MSQVVVDGATVMLTTDGTWLWESGSPPSTTTSPTLSVTLSVAAPAPPLSVRGQAVARASDVAALKSKLASAPYLVAPTFPKSGVLKVETLTVDDPTSSQVLKTADAPLVLLSTTGKFTATVSTPASNTAAGTTDLVLSKSGTWTLTDAGQGATALTAT